ncbi:uncharacterized protein K444DRAFT_547251, partial [Hyaloscypha bicolor E]
PLNISIFRPWKYYYKIAIYTALRSLNFKYIITFFFRNLTLIHTQIIQKYIIKNAFKSSGI